jgi:uncharacterized protein YgiM (DUF1202 family)
MNRNVKIICVVLAAVTIVSLGMVLIIAFSGSDKTNEKFSDVNNTTPIATKPIDVNDAAETTPSDATEIENSDDTNFAETEPTEEATDPPIDESIELLDGYEAVNEEVRVLGDVHLRNGPGKQYEVVAIVDANSIARRFGIGKDGWSLIEISSCVAGYVASYYLSPTKTPTYEEVSETVYATRDANVRCGPSIQNEQIGSVTKGMAFTCIGIGDNGWSKIIYNGEEAYIYSMYITTVSPHGEQVDNADYQNVNETVRFASKANVRVGPGTNYPAIATLPKGEIVTRIGIGNNGWSKILYNGQECYVATRFIINHSNRE